ncbi:MAG: DUF4430 domain-containing protein [Thermoleophilaceae bacterium]
MATRALCLVLTVAAIFVAGCGLGAGAEQKGKGVKLSVTRDFGEERLSSKTTGSVKQDQTVMRLLRSSNTVKTRYGGGFVQSIDGLAGTGSGGAHDWFYYVNGILADKGAAEHKVRPGDTVQWDYRYRRSVPDVKAIVGAFPEPFVNGLDGRRFPVRVECQTPDSAPCKQVKETLSKAGAAASGATLGAQGAQKVARVVVADWKTARQLPTLRAIEQGPKRSGVFARFAGGGSRLDLLDDHGRTVRTEGPDTGLVAALRPTDLTLTWVVTGGSAKGVGRAAAAFDARSLRDAFAVAAPGGQLTRLPARKAAG